jgi:hypothetical protein
MKNLILFDKIKKNIKEKITHTYIYNFLYNGYQLENILIKEIDKPIINIKKIEYIIKCKKIKTISFRHNYLLEKSIEKNDLKLFKYIINNKKINYHYLDLVYFIIQAILLNHNEIVIYFLNNKCQLNNFIKYINKNSIILITYLDICAKKNIKLQYDSLFQFILNSDYKNLKIFLEKFDLIEYLNKHTSLNEFINTYIKQQNDTTNIDKFDLLFQYIYNKEIKINIKSSIINSFIYNNLIIFNYLCNYIYDLSFNENELLIRTIEVNKKSFTKKLLLRSEVLKKLFNLEQKYIIYLISNKLLPSYKPKKLEY